VRVSFIVKRGRRRKRKVEHSIQRFASREETWIKFIMSGGGGGRGEEEEDITFSSAGEFPHNLGGEKEKRRNNPDLEKEGT